MLEGVSPEDSERLLVRPLEQELRDAYVADCDRAMKRWNKALEEEGVSTRLFLPHRRDSVRQIASGPG